MCVDVDVRVVLSPRVSVEVNDEFSGERLPLASASSSEPFKEKKNPHVLASVTSS